MDSADTSHTNKYIRNFLFTFLNKEFLIFLFFLALSSGFWLLMALNETIEREVCVPVKMTGIPRNVILTTDLPDSVRITVRDKGYTVMAYFYTNRIRPVTFQFKNYAKNDGTGNIPSSEILKAVRTMMYGSTKILQIKPDRLSFTFNYGQHKRLPVRLLGRVLPGQSYYLARTAYTPDSVDVFASRSILDSLEFVYTEWQDIRNVTDTIRRTISLRKMKGVKCVPAHIKMSIYPDVLTEETIDVPVVAINMPPGKVLRTFPAKVKVTFVVGASMFRSVNTDKFYVVADYNELIATPSDKCTVYLRSVPFGVKRARLLNPQVDYLIEQQFENENSDNRGHRQR